jgi:hypothetical protein
VHDVYPESSRDHILSFNSVIGWHIERLKDTIAKR